jgi:hypothetical protein
MNTNRNAHPRDRRSYASRLTVVLPVETMTALKIHAAARRMTIREIITQLVRKELERTAA